MNALFPDRVTIIPVDVSKERHAWQPWRHVAADNSVVAFTTVENATAFVLAAGLEKQFRLIGLNVGAFHSWLQDLEHSRVTEIAIDPVAGQPVKRISIEQIFKDTEKERTAWTALFPYGESAGPRSLLG